MEALRRGHAARRPGRGAWGCSAGKSELLLASLGVRRSGGGEQNTKGLLRHAALRRPVSESASGLTGGRSAGDGPPSTTSSSGLRPGSSAVRPHRRCGRMTLASPHIRSCSSGLNGGCSGRWPGVAVHLVFRCEPNLSVGGGGTVDMRTSPTYPKTLGYTPVGTENPQLVEHTSRDS